MILFQHLLRWLVPAGIEIPFALEKPNVKPPVVPVIILNCFDQEAKEASLFTCHKTHII